MIFKWETDEERVLRFMRISPRKKMEWLCQMHEFMRKALTGKRRKLYFKLREGR